MAQAFNLTAQLNLQGPSNLKTTVARIRRELGSVSGDIKININASSIKSIDSATAKLKSLNDALIQSKGNVDSLSRSFSSLSNNITSLGSGAKQVSTSAASIATNSSSAAKNIKQTSDAIEDFGKKSALAVKRFAAFSIVTTGIYALTNSITSGLKAFISFDRELIKLQQVTGKGAAGISSLEKEITRLATSLGVSSESLLSVASTLAQAGLSADQTRIALGALAKTELAPSFDNLTDTTEGAIAALKQFGLQAQDLEAVLGSINAVAAAFAVESRDIIAAIQRTGGVFASASKGVTEGKDALNEFIAVFTSVRATTRESAETIATGLRTIFTRIQRAKTIDLLKEYGVVLTDLEGKFVGPFEAVKRLSAALNQIDPRDIRFSSIIEELGGFRQIGKVIPLIQQFATAQEALRVAQKGQSSLTDAQVKAQQSLANQIAKVREQFLALIRDVGKSAVFQGLFKVVTSLASGLISLASAFKPILPILAIFGAIKGIGAVGKFATGFVGSFAKGGGSRDFGETVGGTITGNSERDRAEATKRASQHIAENTTAIQSLTSSVNTLDKTLNTWAAVVRTLLAGGGGKTLNQGGKVLGFARGGVVPGTGNRDTVPAMLQPGEFVIRKNAVNAIGADKLNSMNKYASGGPIKKYAGDSRLLNRVQLDRSQLDKPAGQIFIPEGNQANRLNPGDKFRFNIVEKKIDVNEEDQSLPSVKNYNKVKDNASLRGTAFEQVLAEVYGAKKSTNPSARLDGVTRGNTPFEAKSYKEAITEQEIGRKIIGSAIAGSSDSEAGAILAGKLQSVELNSKINTVDLGNVRLFTDLVTAESGLKRQKKTFGGFIKRFENGGEALAKDVMDLGGAKGMRQLLGIPAGNRDFGKLMFGPNILAGKNLEAVAEYVKQAKEARARGISAQEQAFAEARAGAFKVQIASILPIDSSFDETYDIEGRRVNIVGGGLLAQYTDVIAEMQSEAAGLASRFAERLQGRTPAANTGRQAITSLDELMGQGNIEGAVLEKALALLGAPLLAGSSRTRPIDYPAGLGASAQYFKGLDSSSPTEVKRVLDKYSLEKTREEIARAFRENVFANGGSSEDTVPALLTPGEFVINKRAAKKIGSAKLHRLNKADKLEGYNKGGAVGYIQKLADGGGVTEGDINKLHAAGIKEFNKLPKDIQAAVEKFFETKIEIDPGLVSNVGDTAEQLATKANKIIAKAMGEAPALTDAVRQIFTAVRQEIDAIQEQTGPPVSVLSPERKAAIRAAAAEPFQEKYKAAPAGFTSPKMGIRSKEDIKNIATAKAEAALYKESLAQVKLNKDQEAEINNILSQIKNKYREQYSAATTTVDQEQVKAKMIAEQAKAARGYIEAGVGAGTVQERVDLSFGREAPKTVSDVGAVTFDAKKMATQKADREAFFEYKARKQGVSVEDYKYGLAQQLGQKAVAVADPGMYKGRAQEMGFELAGKQETLTGIGATISKASAAVKANPKDAAAQTQLADAQSRLAQEAEKIAAGMMALNPTLDMDKTSKAASEVAALLSEGRLSEAQAKLIESLGKAPEGVDAMNIAMEQLAKEAGVSADLLKAEFAAGTKGGKQAKQQQFIASREGQRFGMFAELAPDLAQRISGSKFGGALGKGADFVSGKGGKYSRAFSKLGGFSGIGGGIAVGAEALKNVLPTSVTSNPNVAGALGGLTGAGTGAATGAQLGSLAGPIGTLIGGVGGAIIGGIKGFFDAKNQAILTNALDNLSKSTSDLDEAFKKLDQDASNTNLQAAQKAFGKVIEAQQRVGNINSPEARAAMIQSAGSNVQTAQRLSEVTLNKQTTQQIGDTLNEIKNGTAAIGPTAKAYEDAMIAAEGGMGALSDKEKESIRTRAKEQAALDAYIQKRKQSGASDEQIEAAISKNRKRAIAEGAASVKIADEAGLKQELLARATKEVAVASENLLDVYRRIGASLQRFSDEVDRSIAGIQGSIGDLTGNAQVQKVDRTNEQILGNISAYSMEEVRGAAQVSAGMMGGGAQAGGLVDTAVTAKVLQDQLPALLRQTEGRNVGDVMDILEEQITSATGQSSEAVKQVLQQARTTLESQATSEQGTSFAELAGSDITQKISDTVQEGLKVAVNVQKTYNDTLDKTIDLQNQYNKTIAQAREYNRKATSIRLNAELDLAKALGKNISLEALNKPFETEIKSLTQGLVGGGGTTDPAAIAAAISQKQQENKTLEQKRIEAQGQIGAIGAQGGGDAQQAAAAAATQTIYGLNDSMAKNKLAIDEGRSALEKLANDGSAAANALSKIQEQQQKVEGIGNFIDKLATADPAELFQINKQGAALELALSGRAGNMFKRRSFRQDALAGLEQEREMLTSEEYKTAKAKIKEQELRAAGFKEGDMITTKSGTQIEFTDLIKRLTEGPGEEDPQVKAYREATERQAQAAEQLGKLSNDAATILKDEIGSIFEKLKTDFPNIVTKAFADARADAAALLAGQEGKKPEAAAKPGRDVSAIETDIAAEQKKVSEIDAEIKAREKDVRVASKTIKENQGFFGSGIQLSMAQKQKKEAEKKIKDLREQRAQASANVDQLNQEKEDTTKAQEQAVAQQTEQQTTAKPATTAQQAAAAFTPGSMMQQMMGPGLTSAMQQQMVGTLGTTGQTLSQLAQTPAIQEVANASTTGANIPALAQAFTTMTPGGGNGLAGIVNSVAPMAGPLATQMNMGYNNQTNAGGAQGAAAPAAPVTAESLKAFSDTLSTVFNGFGSYVEQLAGIKLPEKIEMVGNHVVDVRVTGAAAFEALQDGIKELINSEIDNKMSQIWSQTGGALGSRPGSSGKPRKPPARGSEGYG